MFITKLFQIFSHLCYQLIDNTHLLTISLLLGRRSQSRNGLESPISSSVFSSTLLAMFLILSHSSFVGRIKCCPRTEQSGNLYRHKKPNVSCHHWGDMVSPTCNGSYQQYWKHTQAHANVSMTVGNHYSLGCWPLIGTSSPSTIYIYLYIFLPALLLYM